MTEQNNQFTDFDDREKPKTLRDEFAMACLPFFLEDWDEEKMKPMDIAKACYSMAYLMMEARKL